MNKVWIVALALCAGCAGGGSLPSGGPTTVAGPGWLSPQAKHGKGKQLIYVADFTGNAIEIYSASGSNQSPIGQITDGISGPEGCAVDRHGNLYVANAVNQTVTMYPHGGTTYKLLYTGFAYPTNVNVDSKGTVYVADLVGEKVVEFPRGKTRSSRTISISYPQGVGLDAKNNLYIEYNTGSHGAGPGTVNEYPPKSTKGTNLNLPISWAAGDAVDGSGDIAAADQNNAAVYVFPPGSTTPSLTITQGLEDPFRLAFDKPFAHLYVADPEVAALRVYDYPSGTLVNTITSGLKSVYGVAVSPPGN
jgi:sugar lactone lactonase YvrE